MFEPSTLQTQPRSSSFSLVSCCCCCLSLILVVSRFQADVIYMSPPWGGPEYIQADVFDLKTMIDFSGLNL